MWHWLPLARAVLQKQQPATCHEGGCVCAGVIVSASCSQRKCTYPAIVQICQLSSPHVRVYRQKQELYLALQVDVQRRHAGSAGTAVHLVCSIAGDHLEAGTMGISALATLISRAGGKLCAMKKQAARAGQSLYI